MTADEEWTPVYPGYGVLETEKCCPKCGEVMWTEMRMSPDKYNRYELIMLTKPCRLCTPEGERDGASVDTGRRPNNRVAVEPYRLRLDAVAQRRGAGPMAMIHNLAHRLQEVAGRRVCAFCGFLTGNRYRPISFSLGRRARHGRRVVNGDSPH